MPKHKGEDYKVSAVQYFLENDVSYSKTCEIFKCSERSLKRWIDRYKEEGSIKRHNRLPISYKVTKNQVKYILKELKKNEQITMKALTRKFKKKFPNTELSRRHIGRIIRDNDKTRKRTRHFHYPKIRYGRPTNLKRDLNIFYKEIDKYPLDKIISLDETSIQPAMIPEYSRCDLGKRCIYKTDNSFVFRKFTLLVAISNSKCIGYRLYEKGGMTKERFVEFLENFIFGKYTNHLIILDNAGSHKNNYVKNAIEESDNKYLFSVPYNPKTNGCIEMFFNQMKHYMKLSTRKTLTFDKIKKSVERSIKKIKKRNYKNYFNYTYNNQEYRKLTKGISTLHRKPKIYKRDN